MIDDYTQDGDGRISRSDFFEGAQKDSSIMQSINIFKGLV
jgi:hypothetical protein